MFGRQIETSIDIAAPPAKVWEVLTAEADCLGTKGWNPFLVGFDGQLQEGSRIAVTIQPPGGRSPQTFKPKLLAGETGAPAVAPTPPFLPFPAEPPHPVLTRCLRCCACGSATSMSLCASMLALCYQHPCLCVCVLPGNAAHAERLPARRGDSMHELCAPH